MAYRDYKVVVWIPYGRENTVSILYNYIKANSDIVDELWLCMNTDKDQNSDRDYAQLLEVSNPGFVYRKHYEGKALQPKQLNTGKFYKQMTDPDTIYIRMDDDLVWLHPDYFQNMLDFRIDNPNYFITFGHIWNNAIISYLQQQKFHNLSEDYGVVKEMFAMDVVAWQSPNFAEHVHQTLLDRIEADTTDVLFFDRFELEDARRFSVSNFAHFGKDFAKFKGNLKGEEEEHWLTEVAPKIFKRKNAVCGNALICHWAFFAQRPHLEFNTDFLDQYRQLSSQYLSDNYYKLLNKSNEDSNNN